jgi:peptidyl-prolyl cis-trans isomerase SurA
MMTMKYVKNGLLTLALLTSALGFSETLDRIIAVVNNDIVTAQELSNRMTMVKNQYKSNPSVLPNDQVLSQQILDALILESLQLQLAERGNLVIPEQQIDNALTTLAQNQNMTLDQFLTALQNSGRDITEIREQIRNELSINEVQQQIVGRQIFISDSEIERFLKSQSGQSLQDTQYQLGYLRLNSEDKPNAEELLSLLNSGASILEQENSRDLEFRLLEDIPSIFRTLVPVLKKGEAVLLEKDNVLHLAQLLDKTEIETLNIEEYNLRHILIKPDELFDAQSARDLITDLRAQIEEGADMASLADTYSQDTGTRGRGGDLGWSNLDTFVPEFAQAARSSTEGELSDVIETQYGLHILRVEGIRTRDVGLDVLRNQVRNQLYQRRYSESLQRWLVELRAESYVELRP